MKNRVSASLSKTFSLIVITLYILLNFNISHAALTTLSIPFTNFTFPGNIFPVLSYGSPFRDYELSQDPTSGGTGVASASIDLASGCPSNSQDAVYCPDANCNPNSTTDPGITPFNSCGLETTAFRGRYDPDTGTATCDSTAGDGDEILFFRLRINGNVNNQIAFENNTWVVFLDINNDGWNDFQVAVDGNIGNGANATDQLLIFNNTSTTTQSCLLGTSCTQRDVFRACNQRTDSSDTDCQTQSHTRSISATNEFAGSATDEFFLDMQVPITAFTNESNDRQIFCDTDFKFAFGTTASPNDAFQKDAIPNCTANQQCDFGDTTPVTLSYFSAVYSSGGIIFRWSTESETANAGFNIYAQEIDGLASLNNELIQSNVVNSHKPQDYEYVSTDSDSTVFFLADVDIKGKEKLHGPFYIDQKYGSKYASEKIDWKSIRNEHEAKELNRTSILKSNFGKKMKNLKSDQNFMAKINANNNFIQSQVPGVDILVNQKGLYRITYQDLLNAGADFAGVPSSGIAITNFGNPVPLYVYSPSGVFGPGDYIEFIGNGYNTLYTDNNVYVLSVNSQLAQRINVENKKSNLKSFSDSYTESLTIDINNDYYIGSPGDPWYDTLLFSPATKTINFNIDNLASTGGNITLKLIGGIDFPEYIDHHFIVRLNGVQVAEHTFDGVQEYITEIDINASNAQLQNGNNELKIIVTGNNAPIDLLYFDSIKIEYPRKYSAKSGSIIFNTNSTAFKVTNLISHNVNVYRVSDSDTTWIESVQIEPNGPTYTASFAGNKTKQYEYYVYNTESVLSPDLRLSQPITDITSGSAQYLIISHPDFISGLKDLVNERNADYSVKTVNVDDIYAQFGYGIFGANAIKEYINYAYVNMSTRFVLLVGADTYDYKDYLAYGSLSFIPTIYANTNIFVNYGPSDSLYADVDGDNVQDLAIGRFPVRTSADLDLIVQKTLSYPLAKNDNAVFAADFDDGSVSFSDLSDELADDIPLSWTIDRAYLQELGLPGARNLLISSLNDPAGSRAFTSFSGHSAYSIWTFSGLFNQNDAASLTNTDSPTVVSQFGCWNTYFVDPLLNTLSHKFLLSGTNGAVLVAGPSGLSNVNTQQNFGKRFYSNIFSGMTVGEASMQAKQEMLSTGQYSPDVVLGWNLLGDPALVVTD